MLYHCMTPPHFAAAITSLVRGGGVFMRFSVAAAALCLSIVSVSAAQSSHAAMTVPRPTNIPAQPLESALQILANEHDLQVIYASDLVDRKQCAGAVGIFTPDEALGKLLAGTGLTYRYLNDATVTIVLVSSSSGAAAPSGATPSVPSGGAGQTTGDLLRDTFLVAQATVGQAGGNASLVSKEGERAAQGSAGSLQEVIVTAEKRTENVQAVPMTITTVSADALAQSGIRSIEDLSQLVPGLSFNNAIPGQENITLRGVAASTGTATVAFYLDEVPLPTGVAPGGSAGTSDVMGGADPAIFDLDRIEVLQGPQGTLYGASSMGGTLRYITNAPRTDRVEGYLETEVGDTAFTAAPNYRGTAVLNAPLIDGIAAVRGGIQYSNDAGFGDRVSAAGVLSPRTNGANFVDARLEGLIRLGDALSLKPMLYYQNNSLDDVSVFASSLPEFEKYSNIPETETDTTRLGALTLKYQLDGSEFTSVSAYSERSLKYFSDYGNAIYSILETILSGIDPALGPLALPYRTDIVMPNEDYTIRRDTSEELRLASSDTEARFQWLIGAFFDYDRSSFVQNFDVPGWDALGNAVLTPVFGVNPFDAVNDQPFYANVRINTKEYAAFADATLRIAPRWTIDAGVRWFDDSRERTRLSGGLFGPGPGVFVEEPQAASSDSGFDPRYSLKFQLTPESLLYATAAKGFRQGGANAVIPNTPQCAADEAGYLKQTGRVVPDEYQPDSAWSYELGSKNTLFDNRLLFNATVFYLKWTNIQQDFVLDNYGPGGCGYDIADNAGSATSRGAELEVASRITEALMLRGAFSYDHAALDAAPAGSSATLPYVPASAFSVGAQYSIGISASLRAELHFDQFYTGDSVRNFTPSSVNYNEGHRAMSNLRASFIWENGIQASIFATNLFNAAPVIDENPPVLAAAAAALAHLPEYSTYTTFTPRTIGASVQFRF
jgi:iron complex outermembrane recepter protein